MPGLSSLGAGRTRVDASAAPLAYAARRLHRHRRPMDERHEARENQETTMPYKNRSELPESVRDNLPAHAQDIYKEAFNSAWDEYGQDESRAHRVAWGAVERKYHKDPSGKWVEGPTEDRARR